VNIKHDDGTPVLFIELSERVTERKGFGIADILIGRIDRYFFEWDLIAAGLFRTHLRMATTEDTDKPTLNGGVIT
jgi:hypothetical protein